MTAFDWSKQNRRRVRQQAAKRKRTKSIAVHPNSMAARKWGRDTWRTDKR